MERILKQYESLSEDEAQPRFKWLHDLFEDLITEVYLLFFQSILPYFTHLMDVVIVYNLISLICLKKKHKDDDFPISTLLEVLSNLL